MLDITDEMELAIMINVPWYAQGRDKWDAVGLIKVPIKEAAVELEGVGYAIVTKSEILAISYCHYDAALEGPTVFPKQAFDVNEVYDMTLISSILHNFGFEINYY